ncbi:hypothetical protein CBL_05156 [Carabus blaptoides fortunei]
MNERLQAQIDILTSDQKDKEETIRTLLENNVDDSPSESEMSTSTTTSQKEVKQKEYAPSLASTSSKNSRKRSGTSKPQHSRSKKPAPDQTKRLVALPFNPTSQSSTESESEKSQPSQVRHTPTKETSREDAPRSQSEVKKPQPIHLHTKEGWPELQHQLCQHGAEIMAAKNLRDPIQVQVASADHFRAATRRLDTLQVPYHTYAPLDEKTIRAVIKGIPEGISCEEIKRELEVDLPVISVTRFKSQNGGEKIFDLRRLLHLVVTVPPQRRKHQVGQCFRCEIFGYSALCCRADPKCHQSTDTAQRGSRQQPRQQQTKRLRPKTYAASAATNLPEATKNRTQHRQTRASTTGDLHSAGLINEVIGFFAKLSDELKKSGPVFGKLRLREGRNEAEVFVDEHNVDVLMLGETHLRAYDNPKLRNYILYRTDWQGAGGGGTATTWHTTKPTQIQLT